MSRHHFFAEPGAVANGRAYLDGPEAHHASRVLRVSVGETITIADGTGRVVDAVVTRTGGDLIEARIVTERRLTDPVPRLVLYQGLARRERMELVVQKAVEVGAREVVVFEAERSVVRWDATKRERASERYRAIALSAAKQCRSPWLTDIVMAASLEEALVGVTGSLVALSPDAARAFRDALPPDASRIGIVVGPEGGLSPDELGALRDAGAAEATLGERVLRTETAGPVALALAAYSYGTLG